MAVPLLDLKAQNLALRGELTAAFERVLLSGQYILGPEVAELERQIAALVEARHAIGVSSGTDAILLALMALGIGPGDEVVCPTFTFFATAGCIARTGAAPVFVDSCPVCFNLHADCVARTITAKTKAIIPVHLFGQAANLDAVMTLAEQHRLAVIEDAAQALGAVYKGRKAGSFGTFGAFSFFPSKNLGGFGDGGMLVTNDDELADQARLLRTHGAKPKYYHKYVGANFRLDPLQAALLLVKLPNYPAYTKQRQANAAYYTERLSKLPGVIIPTPAEGCGVEPTQAKSSQLRLNASTNGNDGLGPRIILPIAYQHNQHIWNQYTVRVLGEGRRDALKSFLAARKIGTEIYYPVPMHRQECFAYLGCRDACLPHAGALAEQCLSLPIYPELEQSQLDEVIHAIGEFLAA